MTEINIIFQFSLKSSNFPGTYAKSPILCSWVKKTYKVGNPAFIGGEKVKLFPGSLVMSKMVGVCGFCHMPILPKMQIVKIQKCNAAKSMTWICRLHVAEMNITEEEAARRHGYYI
jgi:hypothetical protein